VRPDRRSATPCPLIREQTVFFTARPAFLITDDGRAKLLAVSPAAIGRTLKTDRKKSALKGISGTKPGNLLKKHISVRTYYPWNERKPGFFEIDTGRL
jgi:hypothetical protein